MIDRFGKDISLKKESDTTYSIRVGVAVSEQFFGWLAGLGKDVSIVSPMEVKQKYKDFLSDILDNL